MHFIHSLWSIEDSLVARCAAFLFGICQIKKNNKEQTQIEVTNPLFAVNDDSIADKVSKLERSSRRCKASTIGITTRKHTNKVEIEMV